MKFYCPLCFVFLLSFNLQSQSLKIFTLKGQVHAYGDECKDAVIQVLEAGVVIDSIITGGNGKFQFETQPKGNT